MSSHNTTGTFTIGLGDTLITPQENLQLWGFARSQVATGVHDDLHARSLVVEGDNGVAAAILSLSLVYIPRDLVVRIRRNIAQQTDIPENNIMISCTHTHSGPQVEEAPDTYKTMLVDRSVESCVTAWKNRFPGKIGIGQTTLLELGRMRRRLLTGGLHPDPQLNTIRIEDADGNLRGVMFNYGCHPSTLDWRNTLYSEDWPCYAIEGIKQRLGNDLWTCYLQSAQGDINTGYSSELSAVGAYMPVRGYWYIEVKGEQMAEAVTHAFDDIEMQNSVSVEMAMDTFEFQLRKEFPVTLGEAEQNAADLDRELADMEADSQYQGTRALDMMRFRHFSAHQRHDFAKTFYGGDFPDSETIEMQALRIGDIVFFSLPGEVFSEIAKEVKERSPFEKTCAVGVTNGYYGYMPTAEEYREGDYEVDGCKYSPEAGQTLIDAALNVIRRLGNSR